MNVYQKAVASSSWASHNPTNNLDPSRRPPPSPPSVLVSASTAAIAVAVAVAPVVAAVVGFYLLLFGLFCLVLATSVHLVRAVAVEVVAAIAGAATAIPVGGWLRRTRLRRSATSTTVSSSSTSEMAVVSSAATAGASSFFSMRDLVPFVSFLYDDRAALRQKLEQHQDDWLRLELTGTCGDPTYNEGSMKDGFSFNEIINGEVTSFWLVPFDHSIPNFVETVNGLELRMSGVVVLRLKKARIYTYSPERAGFDRTRPDTPQMANIGFNYDNGVRLFGRVGPILYEDYINLPTGTPVPNFVRFLEDHRTNNPNEPMLLHELKVQQVLFCKSDIPGIMSVLQSIGKSTESFHMMGM